MSGTNPFRRRTDQGSSKPGPTVINTSFAEKVEARVSPIDTDVHRPPKTKTGKTVRIISPHSPSSDDGNGITQNFSATSHTITSPPPPSTTTSDSSDNEFPEDPFSAGSDGTAGSAEDEGTRENTLRNTQMSGSNTPGPPAMPPNPFAKTLASIGTEGKLELPSLSQARRSPGVEPTNGRPQYDVDGFKKLLLSGEKSTPETGPSAAPPVSFQSQPSVGDSSSNTDTSSISRQSIFDSVSGPLQESPGTSHEGSPLDDDRRQLVEDQTTNLQRSKPSTPRHRRGKLVKANAPLTVSFEDPSLSYSAPDIITRSPQTPSDAGKPLPRLPVSSTQGGALAVDTSSPVADSAPVPTSLPSSPTAQKRNPPVPPFSRRHSQLKQKPSPMLERSTPKLEGITAEPMELSRSPPNTNPKAPPPPPPRRAGALVRTNSSSSASTGASIPSMPPHSSVDDITSNPAKPRPPARPDHSPSISTVKRQQNQFILPGSSAAAPPPPPRRRGSSQSSYNPSRLSGEYRTTASERLRSDSGTSSSSQLQMTPMTATPSSTESKDIMADLSALQREVDELRGKFRD